MRNLKLSHISYKLTITHFSVFFKRDMLVTRLTGAKTPMYCSMDTLISTQFKLNSTAKL